MKPLKSAEIREEPNAKKQRLWTYILENFEYVLRLNLSSYFERNSRTFYQE